MVNKIPGKNYLFEYEYTESSLRRIEARKGRIDQRIQSVRERIARLLATINSSKARAEYARKNRPEAASLAGNLDNTFYIVGLGASAGGQDALQQFFENLGGAPNAAFIVVTHLYPGYRSQLHYILSKSSSMPVSRIRNGEEIKVNHVYVMPEEMVLTIKDRTLFLNRREEGPQINKSIDQFFTSLAEDQKQQAVGVIFSGAGTDGSNGVRRIHDVGGKVFVQDPASSLFATMPASAIKADHPVAIKSPGQLALKLVETLKRSPHSTVHSPQQCRIGS